MNHRLAIHRLAIAAIGLALALPLAAQALTSPVDSTAPPPEPPQVSALKGELLDAVQKNLDWRTAYIQLQGQVGKLQAALATAEAKAQQPAGALAAGNNPDAATAPAPSHTGSSAPKAP